MYKFLSNLSDSLLVTLTAVPFICLAWWLNGSLLGIDDADIFFTYAENLARGQGITYAESIPPVEGYSSMLWMLLSSIVFYSGYSEFGIFTLTCFLFLLTQFISLKIINVFYDKDFSLPKLTYLTLTITSFGYISWSTVALMDTTVWGLIIILTAYNFIKEPKGKVGWIVFCLPFILAPITRPEALLVIPGFLLIYGCYRLINGLSRKPVIVGFVLFALSSILVTIFRYFYFGYFLPNTFYAKVSSSFAYNLKEGFSYLNNFLNVSPAVSLAIFLSIVFIVYFLFKIINTRFTNNDLTHHHLFYYCILSLALLIVPTLNGGDHFNLYRFYQPYYSFFIICLILTSYALFLIIIKKMAGQLFIFKFLPIPLFFYILQSNIFGLNGWVEVYKNKSPIAHEFQISQNGRALGEQLNALFKDVVGGQPSLGVITAGGIARKYNGPIYDLMGLNNSYIAHYPGERRGIKNHAAFEKDAFFDLPINILVDSPDNGFVKLALKGLFQDPRFVNQWRFGTLTNLNNNNQSFQGFFNKDFLKIISLQNRYGFLDSKKFDELNNKWVAIEK
jgi:arabinofuranosyltransferase